MFRRIAAGGLFASMTIGLALAQDTGLPFDSDEPQDTAPMDSMLPSDTDTGAPDDTAMPSEDTGAPRDTDEPGDTGDTEDTGDIGDVDDCEGLGLFVGDLVFSSQKALDDFGMDYDRVKGDLRVVGGEIQDLSALACLTEVQGDFTLSAQGEQVDLGRLARVTGAVRVLQTPLSTLELPALLSAQTLEVEDNPALETLSAPLLSTRGVVLSQMPRLTSVELPLQALPEGLTVVKTGLAMPPEALVADRIVLEDNPKLRTVKPLREVSATDELVITGNPRLKQLTLPELAVVKGELFVRDNGLTDLSGLSALVSAGNLSVLDHAAMTALSLPALVVSGELRLERNASLTRIDAPELTRLQRLVVKECPAFVSFDLPSLLRSSLDLRGLRNLQTLDGLVLLVADEVTLKGNSSLKDVSALSEARIGTLNAENNRKLKEKDLAPLRP